MKVLMAAAIFGISFGMCGCSNEAKFAGRTMPATEAPAAPASSPGAAIQTTADAIAEVETPAVVNPPAAPAVVNPPAAPSFFNQPAVIPPITVNPPMAPPSNWVDVTTVGPNRTFQDNRTGLRWSNRRPDANWQGATNHCSTLTYNGVMGWRLPSKEDLVAARRDRGINGAVWEPQNISRGGWLNISDLGAEFYWGSASASSTSDAWVVYLGNFNEPTLHSKSLTNAVVCVQ